MIMLYVFYIAVYNYLKVTNDLETVSVTLACFTIVNFLTIVYNHFSGVYQPHGLFPHQNSMAMAMHLFGTIFFAAYLTRRLFKPFGILCILAFFCGAVATLRSYSRMAIALMPIGYGLVALACLVRDRQRSHFYRYIAVIVISILGLAVMMPRIVERFQRAPSVSGDTRKELALCAWEMIKDKPMRGVGINNWGLKINLPYEYALRAGRVPNRKEGYLDGIVETVYLLVCAECGIPALLAMLAWFGWYYHLSIRNMRRWRRTDWFFLPAGAFGGLTITFMQSFFEWVLRQQLNLICLMFLFAILSYLNSTKPIRPKIHYRIRKVEKVQVTS